MLSARFIQPCKMPKSRRDRAVTLSKTRKKVGLEFKQSLVDKIRKAVDDYARCFVFTVDNMRNSHLKVTFLFCSPTKLLVSNFQSCVERFEFAT